MVWLPDGEKNLKLTLFVLTECTNVTDRHTPRQTETPHDGAGIASRGKNKQIAEYVVATKEVR